MPPSMLSSEALVIWMFRIAMNEPIMAARTAIQVVTLARFGSAAGLDAAREVGSADIEAEWLWFDMARRSGNRLVDAGGRGRRAVRVWRTRLDGRDHRHARPQFDARALGRIERDPDGDALHHLGEIASGVVRRQQR